MPPINSVILGDTLEVLRKWPDEFIDCILTSPPYYGLRDYSGCPCVKPRGKQDEAGNPISEPDPNCSRCKGSGKLPEMAAQIGLEKTLDEYLEKMLAITSELKRVLKPTGTMWLNMGTSYSNGETKIVVREWYD